MLPIRFSPNVGGESRQNNCSLEKPNKPGMEIGNAGGRHARPAGLLPRWRLKIQNSQPQLISCHISHGLSPNDSPPKLPRSYRLSIMFTLTPIVSQLQFAESSGIQLMTSKSASNVPQSYWVLTRGDEENLHRERSCEEVFWESYHS